MHIMSFFLPECSENTPRCGIKKKETKSNGKKSDAGHQETNSEDYGLYT